MVPCYDLPALHEAIKHDLPPANASIRDGDREMWGAILRQRREPGHHHRRALPPTARPYREDLHREVPERDAPGRPAGEVPEALDAICEGA